MSEKYTAEAWKEECREADRTTLFYLLGIYTDGNPLGWNDEQIGILRDEINSRRPKANHAHP
jgi:hypothetical protein